jgi:hypothetical protein
MMGVVDSFSGIFLPVDRRVWVVYTCTRTRAYPMDIGFCPITCRKFILYPSLVVGEGEPRESARVGDLEPSMDVEKKRGTRESNRGHRGREAVARGMTAGWDE